MGHPAYMRSEERFADACDEIYEQVEAGKYEDEVEEYMWSHECSREKAVRAVADSHIDYLRVYGRG